MSGSAPIHLARMTWQEAEAALARRPVGLLPVGAIEAHGPHLPLDTDVIIAGATAAAAAGKLLQRGMPVVILPSLVYTVSFAGTSFAGTSPAGASEFTDYATSVLASAVLQGYGAIACCNAHLEPAHVDALHAACARVESVTGVPVHAPDQREARWAGRLGREFQAGARHAGAYETSIVMAARPDAVRADLLSTLPAVWIDLPARLRAGARTFLEAGAELGYFGDPASASAEEGHRLLDELASMIVDACDEAGVLG